MSQCVSNIRLCQVKSAKFTLKPKQCYFTQNARSSSIHRCLKSSNSQEYFQISMKFIGFPDKKAEIQMQNQQFYYARHILIHCPELGEARHKCISHWSAYLVSRPWLLPVVSYHTLGGEGLHLQFLLDPSVLPMVIVERQTNPEIRQSYFYLARTWNFTIHLARARLRKMWNIGC